MSQGSSPLGPYYVYYLNANYNPKEPGYPYLLNDFAKIGVTRDAFLLFYDEFPLNPSSVTGVWRRLLQRRAGVRVRQERARARP